MKTIIIKNLSTIKDHIVVDIVNDLMAEGAQHTYGENALKHFSLKCDVKAEEWNNVVTYTVTDDEERGREGSGT